MAWCSPSTRNGNARVPPLSSRRQVQNLRCSFEALSTRGGGYPFVAACLPVQFFCNFEFLQNEHIELHPHIHFRVDVGKSRKHAEKDGWPEGRQACNGRKIKNKLRQAGRTCSPLQHAARTGASCREAILGPTQRRLGRPRGEHENGRPTRK